jgi:hypothetical protein
MYYMGIIPCLPLTAVTLKGTFTGECCFFCPQDMFNKTRIISVFPYKPITVPEMMTIMRNEALDLCAIVWIPVMVLEDKWTM